MTVLASAAQTPEQTERLKALAELKEGSWRIRADWKTLGLSTRLDKASGWLTVERLTGKNEGITSVQWTSHRDSHQPRSGSSFTLWINPQHQLDAYFRTHLSNHLVWARGSSTRSDPKDLDQALEIARSFHQAVVVEQRATWRGEATGAEAVRAPEKATGWVGVTLENADQAQRSRVDTQTFDAPKSGDGPTGGRLKP